MMETVMEGQVCKGCTKKKKNSKWNQDNGLTQDQESEREREMVSGSRIDPSG